MDFNKLLEEKKISKYKLSKESGVPYTTVCDICTGKSVLLKCSAETVVRIAHVLGMKAEDLLGDISYPQKKKTPKADASKKTKDSSKSVKSKKPSGKNKKSDAGKEKNAPSNKDLLIKKNAREEAYKNYCEDLQRKIKDMGELSFLISYLKNNEVEILYNLNRKNESRYLLALVDELCVKYNFPLCKEYDFIRNEEE